MTGGVEGGHAGETLHRLGWLLDHFRADRAVGVRRDIIANTRVGKVVGKDSFVECRDVMALGSTEFDEETKEKVFNKPDCSDRAITEDATALDLHHSCCVVQVNGDTCRDTTKVSDREPKDAIKFNTFVVITRFYVGTRDCCFFRSLREAWGEGRKCRHSNFFVEAR